MRSLRSPRTAAKSSPHSPQLEKVQAQQRRPNAAKNKLIKNNNNNELGGSVCTNIFTICSAFYIMIMEKQQMQERSSKVIKSCHMVGKQCTVRIPSENLKNM